MQPNSHQRQIADNLRYLRAVFGYTQADIARAIHVCRCTYVQYETGKKLAPMEAVLALARFYNVSLDMILETDKLKSTGRLILASSARTELSKLLSVFRRLSDSQQQRLLTMARLLVTQEKMAP